MTSKMAQSTIKPKSILVAGGAGFIGSHLCDLLLSQGHTVAAIDNLVTGRMENLDLAVSRGLKFFEFDINSLDGDAPAKLFRNSSGEPLRFDEIYNLASPASPVDFSKMPVFIMNTSSQGHRNLLEIARDHNSRILYASTSEVYGDPEIHPQKETYFGNVNPIGPRACYDEAKRFGEALSVSYYRQHGVDIRIARIFNTYGNRMRPDDGRIIPNFFIQALQKQALTVYGKGSQTRSFCFVSDLVQGLTQLMQSSIQTPVNLGNPIERTVLEIAATVNKLTGNSTPFLNLPLPENDPKQRLPDISIAEKELKWTPKVTLETGLAECLKYFKEELANNPEGISTPQVAR